MQNTPKNDIIRGMENIKYDKPSVDFADISLGDKRLDNRLRTAVESMTKGSQLSILNACGARHTAKAFYSLLGNEKFSLEKISEKVWEATSKRIQAGGLTNILLVQDTSDINLNGHKKTKNLGYSSEHILGVKLHSCLALTSDGVPLGLIAQQYYTRETAKMDLSREEAKKRPIEEKESFRWLETARDALKRLPEGINSIILCDREGDFYEFYADMLKLQTSFVIRLVQNRKTVDGSYSIQQLRRTKACGEIEVTVPRNSRTNTQARTIKMELAYCKVEITRPHTINRNAAPDSLTFNLIRITEIGESKETIEWLLATNLPLSNTEDAMEIVTYYIQRWKIERFHFVLKSGCQVEKIQQRTYERIQPVILIYSVIAVFILAMTYLARTLPDMPCNVFLEEEEWKILYRLITRKKKPPGKPYSLKLAVAYLGELGGYKRTKSDGEYGAKVIWKGLIRLFDAIDFAQRLSVQI
jgi:hypothetical protein